MCAPSLRELFRLVCFVASAAAADDDAAPRRHHIYNKLLREIICIYVVQYSIRLCYKAVYECKYMREQTLLYIYIYGSTAYISQAPFSCSSVSVVWYADVACAHRRATVDSDMRAQRRRRHRTHMLWCVQHLFVSIDTIIHTQNVLHRVCVCVCVKYVKDKLYIFIYVGHDDNIQLLYENVHCVCLHTGWTIYKMQKFAHTKHCLKCVNEPAI